MIKRPVSECITAYHNYMGWASVIPERYSRDLKKMILQRKKLHIFGDSGVGKTHTIKAIGNDLNLDVVISYARNDEDLAIDWGDLPFTETDYLFILEGDQFYWKTYGLIKNYVENSKSPIVIITQAKGKPSKNITKLVSQFQMYPPTKEEMNKYFLTLNPNWKGNINLIYDRDQRKTIRNFLYNKRDKTEGSLKKIDSKKLAYLLLTGRATPKDFENCFHPWYFVLGWLSHNSRSFYITNDSYKKAQLLILWLDTYKFNYKKKYLIHTLINELPKAQRKGILNFPPYRPKKKKVEKEVEESKITVVRHKKKDMDKPIYRKKKIEEQDFDDDIGSFLLL